VTYTCRAGHYNWMVPIQSGLFLHRIGEIEKLLRTSLVVNESKDNDASHSTYKSRDGDESEIEDLHVVKDVQDVEVPYHDVIVQLPTEQSTMQPQESPAKEYCLDKHVLDGSKTEYNELKKSYNSLILKSEALRKQVLYYKTRYERIVEEKIC